MKYVLYFFTLTLLFTAGMLVGNFYIPDHSTSLAAAVSVPDIDSQNPVFSQLSQAQVQQSLSALTQALNACPVVVDEQKELLLNQISLFLTQQDFLVKKANYETEIAKNSLNNRTTAKFSKAAADYFTAKQYLEKRADELFPPAPTPQVDDIAPAADATSQTESKNQK